MPNIVNKLYSVSLRGGTADAAILQTDTSNAEGQTIPPSRGDQGGCPRPLHILITSIAILLISFSTHALDANKPIVPGFERLYQAQGEPTAQQGRVLLGELGCTACHEAPESMGVWHKQAPDISNVTSRARTAYLQNFLQDPLHDKPGTTMPSLFSTFDKEIQKATVETLLHYLVSEGDDFENDPNLEANTPFRVLPELYYAKHFARGRELYHTVGCVACHAPHQTIKTLANPPQPDESPNANPPGILSVSDFPDLENIDTITPSIPLSNVFLKWSYPSLTEFLHDPLKSHTNGRMPHMKLTPEEAHDIAVYLRYLPSKSGYEQPITADPKLAQEGKKLYETLGCAACHDQNKFKPEATAFAKVALNLNKGCLADSPTQNTPWYNLDDRQRAAIRLALTATEPPPKAELLDNKIAALNCYACHERNGVGGIEPARNPYFQATLEADLGDEGRIPPNPHRRRCQTHQTRLRRYAHQRSRRSPVYGYPHAPLRQRPGR